MPVLNLSQIARYFGDNPVLHSVSLQLEPGEKAGLVGANGSGKSTLLKIIAGELAPDEGAVHLSRDLRLGYLPQEPRFGAAGSLRSHLEEPLAPLLALRDDITTLEESIAACSRGGREPDAALLERYSALLARFESEGGYEAESRLMGVAAGLGFRPADLQRDLATFSGGEKTRARLAGLLLQPLDLLLLDEPTNFLDLAALEWLERRLRDLPCAVLAVSHDRFFLDRFASTIVALRGGQVRTYSGNYSRYRELLAREDLTAERERLRRERLQAREERLVREAKADERSKRQARSRQKRLDRLAPLEKPPAEESFHLGLEYSGRSGRLVAAFEDVSKTFGEGPLFTDLSFEIRWGDRVALVGPNGAGKSTLLRLLAGNLEPDGGRVRLGPSVAVTYFAQEQEQLDSGRTLLDTVCEAGSLDRPEARNHLGRYLFRGDSVFKLVGELSGGEKSRLALACLALREGNCLLMDEPTSHLDLPALEELEKVLAAYPGTLVVVSHDRFFLRSLANRVFELDRGRLQTWEGSFAEYLENRARPVATGKEKQKEEERSRRREEHRLRQARQRHLRQHRAEQERLEEEITETEKEVARLEADLSDPASYGDHQHLASRGLALEEARARLARLLERWEEVAAAQE